MPRRVPSRQQRALQRVQDKAALDAAIDQLTDAELLRFSQLQEEAGWPKSVAERAAILDRAKAHVANQTLAEREHSKTAEEHRNQLWGG